MPSVNSTGTKLNCTTFYKFSLYFLITIEYPTELTNPQIIGALSILKWGHTYVTDLSGIESEWRKQVGDHSGQCMESPHYQTIANEQ